MVKNILIRKGERRLEATLRDGETVTFPVAVGSDAKGPKMREGDRRTPEGDYFVFARNPKSRFHLSLALSYPNAEDARRGAREGIISQADAEAIARLAAAGERPPQKTPLGGEIYIHGGGSGRDEGTQGCIGLEDGDIEWLFERVEVGTPVRILP